MEDSGRHLLNPPAPLCFIALIAVLVCNTSVLARIFRSSGLLFGNLFDITYKTKTFDQT
jgi:hypothetical protein